MTTRPREIDATAVIGWLESVNADRWRGICALLWICRDAPVEMFPLDYDLVRENGVTVAVAVTVYTKAGHAILLGTVTSVGDANYYPYFDIVDFYVNLNTSPVFAHANAA